MLRRMGASVKKLAQNPRVQEVVGIISDAIITVGSKSAAGTMVAAVGKLVPTSWMDYAKSIIKDVVAYGAKNTKAISRENLQLIGYEALASEPQIMDRIVSDRTLRSYGLDPEVVNASHKVDGSSAMYAPNRSSGDLPVNPFGAFSGRVSKGKGPQYYPVSKIRSILRTSARAPRRKKYGKGIKRKRSVQRSTKKKVRRTKK